MLLDGACPHARTRLPTAMVKPPRWKLQLLRAADGIDTVRTWPQLQPCIGFSRCSSTRTTTPRTKPQPNHGSPMLSCGRFAIGTCSRCFHHVLGTSSLASIHPCMPPLPHCQILGWHSSVLQVACAHALDVSCSSGQTTSRGQGATKGAPSATCARTHSWTHITATIGPPSVKLSL